MQTLRACNLGNQIFPNTTNLFNVPFNPDVERFNNSGPITIRWWNEDPNCGILDSKLIKTNKRCIVGNQYGRIVEYRPIDINCELPLDDYAPLLGLALVFIILKNRKWKEKLNLEVKV